MIQFDSFGQSQTESIPVVSHFEVILEYFIKRKTG